MTDPVPSRRTRFPVGTTPAEKAFLLNWKYHNVPDIEIEDAYLYTSQGTVAPQCATEASDIDNKDEEDGWYPVLFFEIRRLYVYDYSDDSFTALVGDEYVPVVIYHNGEAHAIDYDGFTKFKLRNV